MRKNTLLDVCMVTLLYCFTTCLLRFRYMASWDHVKLCMQRYMMLCDVSGVACLVFVCSMPYMQTLIGL